MPDPTPGSAPRDRLCVVMIELRSGQRRMDELDGNTSSPEFGHYMRGLLQDPEVVLFTVDKTELEEDDYIPFPEQGA